MTNRGEAEHRLANLVAQWVSAREDKALAMKEHNEGIHALEDAIEKLSGEICHGAYQPGLFDSPPAEAARGMVEAVANLAPAPGSGVDSVTVSAGGKSVTLTQEDGKRLREQTRRKPRVTLAETDPDVVAAKAPSAAPVPESMEDVACASCGHYGVYHASDGGECGLNRCRCEHFVPPDPLGLEGYPKQEAGDATPQT